MLLLFCLPNIPLCPLQKIIKEEYLGSSEYKVVGVRVVPVCFFLYTYTNRINVQKCKLLTPKKRRENLLFPVEYKHEQDNTTE